jgi:hypothetical protein
MVASNNLKTQFREDNTLGEIDKLLLELILAAGLFLVGILLAPLFQLLLQVFARGQRDVDFWLTKVATGGSRRKIDRQPFYRR